MEHLHHFGLRQDPFQNEPDLRFYFDSVSHMAPQRRIERGLRQNKGLCILSGAGGTGKSLLTRRLLESLEEEVFDAQLMLMMPGATDANSVLNRYARMIGVEDAKGDRPALLAQIYEQLAIAREEGRHSVLMLDDAHLFNREALAEIGGLLNLEYEDRRLVSIVLVGLPQLDVTISHEPSLGQRVDVRMRLEPLDEKGSYEYLQHRLSCASGDAATLPPEAMGALYKFGRGRPRLLNTLADNALFEAYLAGRTQLGVEDVERAASDLGVGIDPGSTYSSIPSTGLSSAGMPGLMETSNPPTMELSEVAMPEPELEPQAASVMELDSALEMPQAQPLLASESAPETQGENSESAMDLGELLAEGESPDSELTTVVPMDTTGGLPQLGSSEDLDSAVNEMMSESELGDALPEFEGHNATSPDGAEATRIAFEDELSSDAFLPMPEAEEATPVGDADDELDDLFVELIEE